MGRDRHQEGWLTVKAGNWYGHFSRYITDPASGEIRRKHEGFVLGPRSQLRRHDAKDKLKEIIKQELGPEQSISRPDPDTTFESFANQVYIPMREGRWRPATKATTKYSINHYLTPEFGKLPLRRIDGVKLQFFLNKLAQSGFSGSTIDKCCTYLKAIMRLARKHKYLIEDPAEDLRMPITKKPEKPLISWKQINFMLNNLEHPRDKCLFAIAVFCALRNSEVFGLQWGSYRGDHFMITGTAWQRTLYKGQGKTEDSLASVPIPADIQPLIARWHEMCTDTSPEALMFPSCGKGRNKGKIVPFDGNFFRKKYIWPVADKLGIPRKLVTFQVLRRTAGTDLQKFGSVKDNQTFLRHSNSATTLDVYVQPITESVRQAANARARAVLAQSPRSLPGSGQLGEVAARTDATAVSKDRQNSEGAVSEPQAQLISHAPNTNEAVHTPNANISRPLKEVNTQLASEGIACCDRAPESSANTLSIARATGKQDSCSAPAEDIAVVESRPIECHNTRAIAAEQVKELREFSLDKLRTASGLSLQTIIKARKGGKLRDGARERLIQVVKALRVEQSSAPQCAPLRTERCSPRVCESRENIALVESGPIEYHNTRAMTAEQVKELREFSLNELQDTSGQSRHTIINARNGGKIRNGTRERLIQAVKALNTLHAEALDHRFLSNVDAAAAGINQSTEHV